MTRKQDDSNTQAAESKGRPVRPNEHTGTRHTKVDVSEKGKDQDQKAADKNKLSLS
jgi:hypothetical protein